MCMYMHVLFYGLLDTFYYMLIQIIPDNEKMIIDKIIDYGVQKAGDLDAKDVKGKLKCILIFY